MMMTVMVINVVNLDNITKTFYFFFFSPKISLIHLNAVQKESVHVSEWEKKCAKPEARNTNARLK